MGHLHSETNPEGLFLLPWGQSWEGGQVHLPTFPCPQPSPLARCQEGSTVGVALGIPTHLRLGWKPHLGQPKAYPLFTTPDGETPQGSL